MLVAANFIQIWSRAFAGAVRPDQASEDHGDAKPNSKALFGELDDNRGNDDGDQIDDLDHWVEGRTGSIFERVTDGVPDDAGFMAFGAFAEVVGRIARLIFDQLFGIIPGAARVVHKYCQELSG